MYCPQCGTESGTGLQYCRACGANLKVIGKAVSLSEAIARSDRGPMPKIKEMMKSLKVDQISDEISRALDQMNTEIVKSTDDPTPPKPWWLNKKKKKTAAERRESQITKGIVTLFSGAGLTIFLYYLAGALVLKLPPDVLAKVPFEIDPVVRVLWIWGLIPMLSGVGHILSALLIRPDAAEKIESAASTRELSEGEPVRIQPATSVTDRTTNILEHTVRNRENQSPGL